MCAEVGLICAEVGFIFAATGAFASALSDLVLVDLLEAALFTGLNGALGTLLVVA